MCRIVAAVLTIWSSASSAEVDVMISTIGRMPPIAAPMPAPTKPLRQRGVPHALGAELVEQPQADAKQPP
jgi:hypothetical protein